MDVLEILRQLLYERRDH